MSDEAYEGYPSPRRLRYYAELYGKFHTANPKRLSGKFPPSQVTAIRFCVDSLRANWVYTEEAPMRLLDYGSGKGYQYLAARQHDKWGGILPYCYDPGVQQLSARPRGKFDGIICCDVLEHIHKADLRDVLNDIFGYANEVRPSFIYLHTCCRPAHKYFPDGSNLHATIQPRAWWEDLIRPYAEAFPNLLLMTTYEGEEYHDPKLAVSKAVVEEQDDPTEE